MFPLQLNDQIIQSLSKNELKILQYVYGHSSETCEMSIHEFSRVISYSPATVLRFCRKLGFSGFAEFKYALRTNASRQPETITQTMAKVMWRPLRVMEMPMTELTRDR